MEKKFAVTDEDIDRLLGVFSQLNPTNIWSQVKKEDFTVKRFDMGFVNDISCCELTPEARSRLVKTPADVAGVVVKFKPKQFFVDIDRLEFVANNAIMSELGITPRLLYIDADCMINEYVPSRNYKIEEDLDPKTVKELARVLARIHSAKPPISSKTFKNWEKLFDEDSPMMKNPPMKNIIDKKYLDSLKEETEEIKAKYWDLLESIEYLESSRLTRELSKKVNSTFVFSHSDFNRGNRLVAKVKDPETGVEKKRIWIVDFDYSTINYRGIDFGRYFSNYRHEDDMFGDEGFPTDEEMALFLEEYRQECARIQGQFYLEANPLEMLIREAKIFAMQAYSDFFFCLMMYTNDPKGPRKDYFLVS
ncbi:hypothetical protein TYRP_014376 [Tyrophagus putrescentiae]|nr:hypothetical protein TYRP_014376 [Tyrophagus putrescentiae]